MKKANSEIIEKIAWLSRRCNKDDSTRKELLKLYFFILRDNECTEEYSDEELKEIILYYM